MSDQPISGIGNLWADPSPADLIASLRAQLTAMTAERIRLRALLREALAVLESAPEPLVYKGNDDYATKDLPADYKFWMWYHHGPRAALVAKLREAVG